MTKAVVAAAGMGRRIGASKPLLPLPGGETFITHIINTFTAAGVDEVVVVTGYNADAVKAEASRYGAVVTFVHNPDYETTDMFHSVKLGLRVAATKSADFVLFTPVDAPLFTADLVTQLLTRLRVAATADVVPVPHFAADVVVPVCGGRPGHPIAMTAETARLISQMRQNEGGLGGALKTLATHGHEITNMETEDENSIKDFDTPQSLQSLIQSS
jgi:CTP:molybdopterin cytidylyltransferase MocA